MIGADVATDRCFLRAEGELQPVPRFRESDSLLVGETVYTIGSPKGLVNTLGSGLLSGPWALTQKKAPEAGASEA